MSTVAFRTMTSRLIVATVLCMVSVVVSAQTTVKYVHTDALGSVVAMTDSTGNAVETHREYEPYGYQSTPTTQDGPGYTGHVQDAATGLTYMQQRYYDPTIGRMLSVDPVTAYSSGDMRHFNVYAYSFNNPYRFTDPDGRNPSEFFEGYLVGFGNEIAMGTLHDSYGEVGSAREAGFQAGQTGGAVFDMLNPRGWVKSGGRAAARQGVREAGDAAPSAARRSADNVGSPTAYKPVDARTRERILTRDQKSDGSWDCATCGQNTRNPDNIHTGHVTPRSRGGDLSDGNLRCEGAACNLSQGNRDAPRTGMTCAERGSCGAPYGRTD